MEATYPTNSAVMTFPPGTIGPLGVTDGQAKAVSDLANLGTTVVTEVSNPARYIARIVGTVPEDAVGFVLGDPLHAVRTLAAGWYDIKVAEILERRRAKPQPVSLSVALPLMRGAYDETRDELRGLWAQLIATAMDPDRCGQVRISFIDTLRQFDPLDALVLKARHEIGTSLVQPHLLEHLRQKLAVDLEELIISIQNLQRLNCSADNRVGNFQLSPYGRGLLRACSDCDV
jgi:hypothetical protein